MTTRKKLNNDILSIRDFNEGVEGKVGEITPMQNFEGQPVVSKSFGTPLYTVDFINTTTGEIKKYWADAGLRGAFKMAKILPGQNIAVQHTGEKEIEYTAENGKPGKATVQTYDIFEIN